MRAAPREIALRAIVGRFWPFAAPRRGWLLVALLLSLLPPLVNTAEIWLFKVLVDDVLLPREFALFPTVAAAYVGLTVLEALISGSRRMLSTWLSQRFLVDLRTHLLRHFQRLSPTFFHQSKLGDLLARMSGDVAAIEAFVVSAVTSFTSATVQIVVYVGALFYLQWQLALVALVVTPLFWYTARRFSGRTKSLSREKQRLSGTIGSVVEQTLSNITLVQAYGQEERQVARFSDEAERKYRVEMASARLKSVYTPVVDLIELLGVLTVLGTGAWLLSRGQLSVGELLAFLTFLGGLYGPVRRLGSLANTAYAASAGAERVIQVLDQPPAVQDAPDAVDVGVTRGHLEVRDLTFRYPGSARLALDAVSFSVGPGETVAVVGASGAGKSTLAKLLVRFFDPEGGQVLLDGHDITSITLGSLRRNVTVLLQETLLLDGTIHDNITYGRSDASTEADVEGAAVAADADGFIGALPQGYDTEIGERGRRLSGGQGQRLAIARAMLRNAPVLLLDEPTTGLDAQSTARLVQPMRRLMTGRATVIISHNLTTVREATSIVVLDQGRVVERGTHDELLRLQGRYAELWRQSGLDQPPPPPTARRAAADGEHGRARRALIGPELELQLAATDG
ncbi:ATP-binding cassette, subfamily B, MsbA [Friedmanniella luteola]|uniref:ATP-binding cassette, subfamily B, MsbA n=1 Tax=Friedmanniella luteola TaxID=546871 RepID=A0A1H2A9S1_9ACTN|nr:ABC transporter ATP-binding protein [Friedmanniella luteola]SDT42236.1 ATP-binding cassette, subfamily B, MsbA [Friedmanniella luteola]